MALRCRRAGAVHSIISGQTAPAKKPDFVRFGPEADKGGCGWIVRDVPLGDIPTNSNGALKAPFTLQERCDYTRYGANDAT